MRSQVFVAHSENFDSELAINEIIEQIPNEINSQNYNNILVLLFNTVHYDYPTLQSLLKNRFKEKLTIIGTSTTGIITNSYLGYSKNHLGMAVIASNNSEFICHNIQNLNDREYEVGKELATKINELGFSEEEHLLLMYDSVKQTAKFGQPALNLATPLINGIIENVNNPINISGFGSMSDIGFDYNSYQWLNDNQSMHSILTLLLKGRIKMDSVIIHGTKPISEYYTITKAINNVIIEIDKKPALEKVSEILGDFKYEKWNEFPLLLTLGVNKGNKFDDYKEENYANRLCLAIDKESKSLIMFEPDLKEGMEFQIMKRSIDFKYMAESVNSLIQKIENDGRKPILAFYINCLGRCAAYCGLDSEDAAELQLLLSNKIPLLGIYTGVEIAKVGSDIQALDWTGVLCMFSE